MFVEDNPADVRLLNEGLAECGPPCSVTVATDGAQALDMLFRRGKYAHEKLPDTIFLDLNLPMLNGFEVLAAIKANQTLGIIPVVILSTSTSPRDINKAYDLGASCYIVKPRNLEELAKVCSALHQFWFSMVRLPRVLGSSPA